MSEKTAQVAIVRGMTANWFMDHFKDMKVYFGGKYGVPVDDSDYGTSRCRGRLARVCTRPAAISVDCAALQPDPGCLL